MTESKTSPRTSYSVMRHLLNLTTLAVLLALVGMSNLFACPAMASLGRAQKEPCSHCPSEKQEKKQEKGCPRSACITVCPYGSEKTAVVSVDDASNALVVYRRFADISPLRPFEPTAEVSATLRCNQRPLYLLNRVLLI